MRELFAFLLLVFDIASSSINSILAHRARRYFKFTTLAERGLLGEPVHEPKIGLVARSSILIAATHQSIES
jgi:hypothetical protein